MRQIYKFTIVSALFAFGILLPSSVGAVTGRDNSNKPVVTPKIQSCTKIPEMLNNINSDLDGRNSKLETERNKNQNKIESKRQEADAKLAQTRQEADAKRAENFKNLEAKATTDSQKAAVQKFEQTVIEAVKIRREAHDANRLAFRQAVDALVQTRQAEVSNAVATLKADYQAAITKAQESCTNGTPVAQVMNQLKSDLAAARDKFKQSKSVTTKIGEQLKALNQTRQEANKKADAQFKNSYEAALKELKAAFDNAEI